MSTKSVHRTFECVRNDMPHKKFVPPWCSSRRGCGRHPKRWEDKKFPIRERIQKNKRECGREVNYKNCTIVLVLCAVACFGALWMLNELPGAGLITKVISTEFPTLLNTNQSTQAACYDRTKHLVMEYSRMQKYFRSMLRVRRTKIIKSVSRNGVLPIRYRYVEGVTAMKGSDTEGWQARLALWGVVPLWKASPPINTVLALRKPVPSDCWPFTGSYGEIIINLPHMQNIDGVSIEHIRPDTARSAPKDFTIHGILLNDTEVKLMENEYKYEGPAKQYYEVKTRVLFKSVLLRILSNQGNTKYTCVYRFHVYNQKLI